MSLGPKNCPKEQVVRSKEFQATGNLFSISAVVSIIFMILRRSFQFIISTFASNGFEFFGYSICIMNFKPMSKV